MNSGLFGSVAYFSSLYRFPRKSQHSTKLLKKKKSFPFTSVTSAGQHESSAPSGNSSTWALASQNLFPVEVWPHWHRHSTHRYLTKEQVDATYQKRDSANLSVWILAAALCDPFSSLDLICKINKKMELDKFIPRLFAEYFLCTSSIINAMDKKRRHSFPASASGVHRLYRIPSFSSSHNV